MPPVSASAPAADDRASEELAEDAAPAAESGSQPSGIETAPPAPDEEAYVWPEGAAPKDEAPVSGDAAAPAEDAPLPPLDALTKRIPQTALETLDDLFRARFVAVRRVPPGALKH